MGLKGGSLGLLALARRFWVAATVPLASRSKPLRMGALAAPASVGVGGSTALLTSAGKWRPRLKICDRASRGGSSSVHVESAVFGRPAGVAHFERPAGVAHLGFASGAMVTV